MLRQTPAAQTANLAVLYLRVCSQGAISLRTANFSQVETIKKKKGD